MEVRFDIVYETLVVTGDIPKLAFTWKTRIQYAIEEKLARHPEGYGKPLRRSLKGYRKLRVGDYRVIFRIAGTRVLIFGIMHRSVVYALMEKRLSI